MKSTWTLTEKRRIALKKGEYVRAYKAVMGQLEYLRRLSGEVQALDEGVTYIPSEMYLLATEDFLIKTEPSMRDALGVMSVEEAAAKNNKVRGDKRREQKL